jgi:hypothetical protein
VKQTKNRQTDALLDVAEKLLLEASDDEVLASSGPQAARVAGLEVQALVRKNIDAANSSVMAPQAKKAGRAKRNLTAQAKHKVSVLASFLRALAVTRPELSPRLQAVFRSSQPPDPVDVEKLAVELLKKHLDKSK